MNRFHHHLARGLAAVAAVAFLSLGMAGLTGCNTVEGVGEDVEAVGDTIDQSSEDVQEDM
jgi:predicted small secreted protein